jgi:5-methyltetrahydrofolate--homocysteine methyltransferase
MDGAMGTELRRAGIPDNACYEQWNLSHPDRVAAIHEAYVDAGAQCLVANTFQANPIALARHGLETSLDRINLAGVALCRAAAGENGFVLASVGPGVIDRHSELVARSLATVDAFLLETWSDLTAAQVFVDATVRRDINPRQIPVLLSLAYRHEADSFIPDPAHIASRANSMGIAALGVNCGRDISMTDVLDIVRRLRQATDLPLFARPNAGTPTRVGDAWVYPHTPKAMADQLPELLESGVRMIGGCCGTTPQHIAAFRPIVAAWNEARCGTP